MSGATFPRSICSLRTLIQTASPASPASPSSLSPSSSPSPLSSPSAFYCCSRFFLSSPRIHTRDFSRQFRKRFHFSKQSSLQPPSFPAKLRGRFREGGADSDSKDGNHNGLSRKNSSKKEPSLLLSLIQEIQPLDISQIGKDASPDSTDAMKRTISGMLGLLPSDQFHVMVETSREPLARLLVSSMMTGYTLRNAEYRLCLQKTLESSDDEIKNRQDDSPSGNHEQHEQCEDNISASENAAEEVENNLSAEFSMEDFHEGQHLIDDDAETLDSLGLMTEEVRNYVQHLKERLMSVSKELEDSKRISTGLQVQSMVGEEKNDLLDYLRSLAPDKVAELSQPTSQEAEEAIEHVINGLLDDPSLQLQHKDVQYGNRASSTLSSPWDDDITQKCNSSPLQSQSALTMNRDYLARLLFWCMLLGHHMRGVEYRLELSRTLSLSGDLDTGINEN